MDHLPRLLIAFYHLRHTIQAEQEENFYEVKYKTLTCFGQIIETINKATPGIRFFTWQSEGHVITLVTVRLYLAI